MAQAVEGDLLDDTGGFQPTLEGLTSVGPAQSFEYESTARFPTIGQCFLAEWQCCLCLGLLSADAHTVVTIG